MEHYFTNNENLKSNLRTITYKQDLYDFSFVSDNGVFSKNHIDYGSQYLVEAILNSNGIYANILDIYCGYGFLGIVLSKILNLEGSLVDVNKRAVHLASMNIKENKVPLKAFESNGYETVTEKYDLIVTNPPIRAGKQVVLDLLIGASNYLNKDGQLWFVIRKDQGAKSIEKALMEHYEITLIEKNKGFYIFMCKNR